MKLLKLFIFILITILDINALGSQNIHSGLEFSAHNSIKEKRTSLVIPPSFDSKDGFTLDFDVKLRLEEQNYGYIFRIVGDDKNCLNLIINFTSKKRSLNFLVNNNLLLNFDKSILDKYKWNNWAHIRCHVERNTLTISFDGSTLKHRYQLNGFDKTEFYFGYSDHKTFHSTDVPPMSIRNIKITDAQYNTIGFWPLKKHTVNASLDCLHNIPAIVKNPTWEIDRHRRWVKEKSLTMPLYTQICAATPLNSIFFASKSYLIRYSMIDNSLDTVRYVSGNPYQEINNQIIYNPFRNELWSYDFDNGKKIAIYNFKKRSWDNSDSEIKNPNYSQHNAFFSPLDSCLYAFGGYGNYEYKNTLLYKDNPNKNWANIAYTTKIPPRYLSGAALQGKSTMLILGGCGNLQGKQELGIKNYYDLYALDLRTYTAKKLWSHPTPTQGYVIGNNIFTDEKRGCIYALCFPNDISNSYFTLKAFNINGLYLQEFANRVPFQFNDINSFCSLYYDCAKSKMFAVVKYNDGNVIHADIYSLAYPPLTLSDTLQEQSDDGSSPLTIVIIALVSLLAGGVFLYKYHNRKKESANKSNHSFDSSSPIKLPIFDEPGIINNNNKKSSILILDEFQVWDKGGNDISKSFTPILRQLLILILLYSNTKAGVSNVRLRELLWFDKSDESAQNNRRVNIRKLKLLLAQLDGLSLIKNGTNWSIDVYGVYCDYIEAYKLINSLKNGLIITNSDFDLSTFGLLSKQLVPYIQEDWLDSFKSTYSNDILDTVMELSRQEYLKNNNDLLITLANIMFAHDKIDEYALTLKCQALYKNGRTSLAKSTFDSFCNEYRELLNIDYTKQLSDILESPSL